MNIFAPSVTFTSEAESIHNMYKFDKQYFAIRIFIVFLCLF